MEIKNKLLISLLILGIFSPVPVFAQDVSIDANLLIPRVTVSVSPRSGSFVEGSTFEVPIILNTNLASVNAVEVKVSYDPTHLSIVQPSGGKSIIGLWAEPPAYDNSKGTASYVGSFLEASLPIRV